jgi:formate dehydrogenase maturation protein FdhE
MKKWLIRCLTVLAMVCLIPGIVLNVKAADSIYTYCFVCMQQRNYEILGYTKVDSTKHRIHIKCSVCGRKNSIVYGDLSDHTGGTETPTCTTGKTCEKCGAEYGILGHKWKTPANASLGNGTHRIICLRCGLNGTASCTGGTATCTTKAVCEACGGKYGKRNLNNHALVHYDAQAPTCTKPGWDAFDTCPRCYYTTFRAIPALKHDLEHHEAKAPTCTEKGWDAYDTCSRCDYTTRKEIPALNHALEQHAAKAPTCTEPGWDAYETCSRCDYTTYAELPAQHDLRHHAAKAPTCTGIGWDAYDTCSRCDYITTYVELPALNHALEQHEAQAPTCTEIGWDAYETCSRCDYTTRKELPALNHALEQHAAKAPTCTEPGWDAYETCSRCDYTTRKELPALNHALEQHAAKAPTCTEPGWDAYETCSRCDYTTRKELPALNHDYQAVTVEPTCETDGYTVFTCSRCNDSYTADPTDQLGHQFGAWSPNGTGSQSADCLRQGCAHTGSTDCRKFTFRTAEGEALIFCPVCGQAENAAQLEKIEAATAWANSGSLSAEDVTARTNGEYLSVAFETAGSLTQPTGRVRLALPAGLLEGKKLVRIAPDGTQTEMPFETERGTIILTLDFANSALPVMLFRLVPQPTAL